MDEALNEALGVAVEGADDDNDGSRAAVVVEAVVAGGCVGVHGLAGEGVVAWYKGAAMGTRGSAPEMATSGLRPALWRVAVRASTFLSRSATLESAFFWRFRAGAVTMHSRPAFRQRLQGGTSGFAGSAGTHLTFSPRQDSHARGFLASAEP